MFNSTHQMKLVVKPPSNSTSSAGRPVQILFVPAASEASLMRLPACSAKAKAGAHDAGKRGDQHAFLEIEFLDGLLFLFRGHFLFLGPAGQGRDADAEQTNRHARQHDLAGGGFGDVHDAVQANAECRA